MVQETILQSWIFTQFAFPFLLIFFVLYGILEKTKVFGEGKEKLNAMVSFVVGLIFVAAISPKLVVNNLILFLTVAIIVVFIALILWGFMIGEEPKITGKFKGLAIAIVIIAVAAALLWALGVPGTIFGDVFDFLFKQDWSSSFWTNVVFIFVVIIAIVIILPKKSGK